METLSQQLTDILQPIAAQFASLNLPEPIVHWGHPFMMGIVVLFMGTAVGLTGWRSRLSSEVKEAGTNKLSHRQIAPLMTLFIVMGYTGGILSLVMQEQPILSSPHFWTGSLAVGLLMTNGLLSSVFKRQTPEQGTNLRTVHAYLGSVALGVLVVHGLLGLKLGLSI